MQRKIINLGAVLDLQAEWEKGRDFIRSGRVRGFNLTLMREDGTEQIVLGGVYNADPQAAVRALLKMSAARVQEDDEPPLFQASSY